MNEKISVQIPESAEREYEMDSYEVRAVSFAQNPIDYLKEIHAAKLESGYDEQNAVFKLIDEFTALVIAVVDSNLQTEDEYLKTYIYSNSSYEQKRAFVSILHAVGVKREHVQNWAEIVTVDSTNEELLEERSYRVAIAEIYEK